jgi:hypothetical protein
MEVPLKHEELSRRSLLQALATAIGAAAFPFDWIGVVRAADGSPSFLTAAESADVEAIAAQILPTDDTPGAREAGVVQFIDRSLATVLSHLGPEYRRELAEFQAACRQWYPEAPSFASLGSDQQVAFLQSVEHTAFFDATRMLTLLGMFTMPAYGGNRDGAGWKLIGLEDGHMFQPPFGHYDRDYPGFVADARPSK